MPTISVTKHQNNPHTGSKSVLESIFDIENQITKTFISFCDTQIPLRSNFIFSFKSLQDSSKNTQKVNLFAS